MKKYAVIVAGGSGNRMQSTIPKQFIRIGSQPVLMHTLRRFHEFDSTLRLILVLLLKDVSTWQILCREYQFNIPVQLVVGGETRFHSVQNGLAAIEGTAGLVAIHDGVRPFVSVETIQQSFTVASSTGCAVAAVPLKESIRQVHETGSTSVDRTKFFLVQTPQTFQIAVIKQSFAAATRTNFTDDASVAEAAGFPVTLVEGSYQNIKITTPEDLLLAKVFLDEKM